MQMAVREERMYRLQIIKGAVALKVLSFLISLGKLLFATIVLSLDTPCNSARLHVYVALCMTYDFLSICLHCHAAQHLYRGDYRLLRTENEQNARLDQLEFNTGDYQSPLFLYSALDRKFSVRKNLNFLRFM